VFLFIVAIWYFVSTTAKSEYERGYEHGKEFIYRSIQLKALRQHLGQSLEQVSEATGLEKDLIKWIEDGEHTQFRKHNFLEATNVLFDHYGERKNSATVYLQFDNKTIMLKPCNGFHSVNKHCGGNGGCGTPPSKLYTIQEPWM
jgi:hypothetical protein